MKSIIEICREVEPNIPDDITLNLIDGGYVDSFGVFMIMASLEIEYDIKIPDNDLNYDNFKSIESLTNLVEKIKREEQ